MTAEATDALVNALSSVEGMTVPRELAVRIEHQLAARGYEIVRAPRGDLRIAGYPCACPRGCIAHPFGPDQEVSP